MSVLLGKWKHIEHANAHIRQHKPDEKNSVSKSFNGNGTFNMKTFHNVVEIWKFATGQDWSLLMFALVTPLLRIWSFTVSQSYNKRSHRVFCMETQHESLFSVLNLSKDLAHSRPFPISGVLLTISSSSYKQSFQKITIFLRRGEMKHSISTVSYFSTNHLSKQNAP